MFGVSSVAAVGVGTGTIADAEHAVASAGLHGAATADDIDGGFSDDDIEAWMETAVDPIDSTTQQDGEES